MADKKNKSSKTINWCFGYWKSLNKEMIKHYTLDLKEKGEDKSIQLKNWLEVRLGENNIRIVTQ